MKTVTVAKIFTSTGMMWATSGWTLQESLQDDMLGCLHTYFFSPFNLPYKTADMVESLQDPVLVRVLACYPEPSPQMFRTGLC